MKNYAFIFARGGSKGLPGKNIRLLAGKPLIHYAIEVAKECRLIDKTFVSTDDESIAKIAREKGAIIIDRPPELASDTSAEWLSWRHGIDWVERHYGKFENFISLPATSPLREVADVEAAIVKLASSLADICIAITPAATSTYFNMVTITDDERCELVVRPGNSVTRRQDAPTTYNITTVVYATTPEYIRNGTSLFSGTVTGVIVPKERAVDIDDIYDFMLAEAIVGGFGNE